jgi:2-oxoglutarate dehydrogenase complex dehydrogenase (E1) component-like enzyme
LKLTVNITAEVLKGAARGGADDVVLTMAHRGRLETLVSVLKYEPVNIFYKLSKGQSLLGPGVRGLDDVLSHIGQSVDLDINGKPLHVSLINNPSHLEVSTNS